MTQIHRFAVPIPIVFGPGASRELGAELARRRIARPLLVSDPGLVDAGLVARIADVAEPAAVHTGVHANPTEADVAAGLEAYRAAGADGVVALGGGSAIDAAKGVRLLASHDGPLPDYDFRQGGMDRIGAVPPMVAIPTTAGTGSEVSRGALIVTEAPGRHARIPAGPIRHPGTPGGPMRRKTFVASPHLVPSLAILDPELTEGLPPALTAGTGMDALCHCVEELCSPRWHPVVEGIALRAVSIIRSALPAVFRHPSDLGARGRMQMAAMMAGIGFEKGLGAVHSLSHAIGALYPLHHGTLNAVLMPATLRFNAASCAPGVLASLAGAAGIAATSDDAAAPALEDWMRRLNEAFAIPQRLRDLGLPADAKDGVVGVALEDHCHLTNPRSCGRPELAELWDAAW